MRITTRSKLQSALIAGVSVAAVAVSTVGVASATAPVFHAGAAGVGDPYFPALGNGGFTVAHYDLNLSYRPRVRYLAGDVRIRARATENLRRFDLDLVGMTVHSVRVDGRLARFRRLGPELRITPQRHLFRGQVFHVMVQYGGSPKTITGSPIVFGSDYGWQYTKDGAFVGDEPNAARTWFPSNDHPSDKATYTYRINVPKERAVVANGDFVARRRHGPTTTYVWNETSPMASYLATIDIGRWVFVRGRTPNGIRELVAYDPTLTKQVHARAVFRLTGRITDYWTKMFGRYPFTSTGAIVDNVPNVGFSLETQTRPLYGFAPDQGTMSHELSHEWFGDSVSVRSWRNIWLNEGFATFAQVLWGEHTGHGSTYTSLRGAWQQIKASDKFWNQSIADPKRNTMFSEAVYVRGAMTLAVLRHRMGDAAFFRLLKRWAAMHRYGNATTAQFERLATQVSGQRLGAFFHTWLVVKRKPASFA